MKGCSGRANPQWKKAWKHTRSSATGTGIDSSPGRRTSPATTMPSATSASRSPAPNVDHSHLPDILADTTAARGRLDIDLTAARRREKTKAQEHEGSRERGGRQWLGKTYNFPSHMVFNSKSLARRATMQPFCPVKRGM